MRVGISLLTVVVAGAISIAPMSAGAATISDVIDGNFGSANSAPLFGNSEAGFDELELLPTAVSPGQPPIVPESGTMLLIGTALLILTRKRLQRGGHER